jgi:hypothetical protein
MQPIVSLQHNQVYNQEESNESNLDFSYLNGKVFIDGYFLIIYILILNLFIILKRILFLLLILYKNALVFFSILLYAFIILFGLLFNFVKTFSVFIEYLFSATKFILNIQKFSYSNFFLINFL